MHIPKIVKHFTCNYQFDLCASVLFDFSRIVQTLRQTLRLRWTARYRFGTRDTWIPWERHNNHTPSVSGNLSSHSATLFCLCAFVIVVVLVIFIVNVFAYLRRPHKYHVKSNNNNNNRNRWSVEQEKKTTKWTIEVFFTTRFFFYRSFCFVIVFLLFSPLLIFSNCLPRTAPYRHWFVVVVVVVVFTTDIVVVNITAVVVVAIIAVVALSMGAECFVGDLFAFGIYIFILIPIFVSYLSRLVTLSANKLPKGNVETWPKKRNCRTARGVYVIKIEATQTRVKKFTNRSHSRSRLTFNVSLLRRYVVSQ